MTIEEESSHIVAHITSVVMATDAASAEEAYAKAEKKLKVRLVASFVRSSARSIDAIGRRDHIHRNLARVHQSQSRASTASTARSIDAMD